MLTVSERHILKEEVRELQGSGCIVPGCSDLGTDLAHICPSGMGGRRSTYNTDNFVLMCREHHQVFDGHQLQGRQLLLRVLVRSRSEHVRNCQRVPI